MVDRIKPTVFKVFSNPLNRFNRRPSFSTMIFFSYSEYYCFFIVFDDCDGFLGCFIFLAIWSNPSLSSSSLSFTEIIMHYVFVLMLQANNQKHHFQFLVSGAKTQRIINYSIKQHQRKAKQIKKTLLKWCIFLSENIYYGCIGQLFSVRA